MLTRGRGEREPFVTVIKIATYMCMKIEEYTFSSYSSSDFVLTFVMYLLNSDHNIVTVVKFSA